MFYTVMKHGFLTNKSARRVLSYNLYYKKNYEQNFASHLNNCS